MKIWPIVGLLFFFAVIIRLWTLGDAGRWSDEQGILEHGYRLVELIEKQDFDNPFWYTIASDHPPFVYIIYGLASEFDFIKYDINEPISWGIPGTGSPIYTYDPHASRLVSVIFSALSVILVFFIGLRYFSLFVGILAAIILAMMPHFVGLSQYVDLENVQSFFFTLCIFTYVLYLEKRNKMLLVLTGILLGINIMIKESNVIILPFFPATYFVWRKITKNKNLTYKHLLIIATLAMLTCFAIWPMVWFHPVEYWSYIWRVWLSETGNTPDVFFGRLMGAHFYYYFVTATITTPLLILLLTLVGMKVSLNRRRKWIYVALLIWLIIPFLMSFFHHRQNMIRYIVQFYIPLSLLAALGYEYLIQKFTKSNILKYSLIMPIVVYMAYALINSAPYYLTYFNGLVGGTRNVYERKLFLIGWFGDGLKYPGLYIAKNAKANDKIGLATNPYTLSSMYRIPNLYYEQFDQAKQYDFVVVNYYNVIRSQFDETILEKDYEVVYVEKASGIDYVRVYKHK